MMFIGFWKVIVGTTLGHEGHHGSVSKRPWVNQLYRMGFNLNGESTLHWIQYHLVEHHPHVNDLRIDPEKASGMGLKAGSFAIGNILRLNPLDERRWRHLGQHIYFVLYMMFYGIFNFIFSITYSITGEGTRGISKALLRYRITGFLVNFLLIIRFGLLPWYLTGTPLILFEVGKQIKQYTHSKYNIAPILKF